MTDGHRLPLTDLRRLARMLEDYEAGLLTGNNAGTADNARTSGPVPCVLLEPFAIVQNVSEHPGATYGKQFTARACQLAPTKRRVRVLRQTPGRPEEEPFRLLFRGRETAALHCGKTTAEIKAQLDVLPGLRDEFEILGKGDQFGPIDNEVEYQAKQWHIRFSEEIEDEELRIDQAADNARLFVDYLWPTATIVRVTFGLPARKEDLSPGAFFWTHSLPGFGWVYLHGECYRV